MITKFTKRLGEKIYELRVEKRMTLRDLAEKASSYMEDGRSISHTSINKYENFGRAMDLDVYFAICKALDIDATKLLTEVQEEINSKKKAGKKHASL